MKNKLTRQIIYFVLILLGLILMVGGIVTDKHGSTVIGLIVAAVNVEQWIVLNKKAGHSL